MVAHVCGMNYNTFLHETKQHFRNIAIDVQIREGKIYPRTGNEGPDGE